MSWALMAWLGCGEAVDPTLAAEGRALRSWRQAVASMEEDPTRAVEAMRVAVAERPEDVLLGAWLAAAEAEAGQLQPAVDRAEALLARAPRFAELRYNRACWLARLGALDAAGQELRRALQDGAARTRDALKDPDFRPHLDHAAFAFLPDEVLLVAVDAPSDTHFLGAEVQVRLRVLGAGAEPLTITAPALAASPVELVTVRQERYASSEGTAHDLVFTLRVIGEGPVELGPFEVVAGPWRHTTRAVGFAAVAPPGRGDARAVLHLDSPVALLGERSPPSVRVAEQVVDVVVGPGEQVRTTPPGVRPVRYEVVAHGRLERALNRYPRAAVRQVRVERGGAVVYEQRVDPP